MQLSLIASPYDCGARDRRMGAGPTHLLEAGLEGRLTAAGHDVETTVLDLGQGFHTEVGAAIELSRRRRGRSPAGGPLG